MLHPAVTADQAMIAVIAAIRLICGIRAGNVVVKAAVRTEVTVRMVCAVRAVVGIHAGTIGIRMVAGTPGVIAVVAVLFQVRLLM